MLSISLIGRANTGKSTMFNYLAGENLAITDSMAGLTRDRKEKVIKLMGGEVKIVDTAGWHSESHIIPSKISNHKIKSNQYLFTENRHLHRQIQQQTYRAIYSSDLILFLLDGRKGILQDDFALAKYIHNNFSITNVQPKSKGRINNSPDNASLLPKPQKKLVLVVNKCEEDNNSIEYKQIYQLNLGEPIFVSSYHGDNMQDLYKRIQEELPATHAESFELKQARRVHKHIQIRDKLKKEVLAHINLQQQDQSKQKEQDQSKQKEQDQSKQKDSKREDNNNKSEVFDINEWEVEFDLANRHPEENSELDSDSLSVYMNEDNAESILESMMNNKQSEHVYRYNQSIDLSIIGRANVGKSSLVNAIMNDRRVVVDELPGTTRDTILSDWVYKGRKLRLIDTAGIEKAANFKDTLNKKISAQTLEAIQYSQVVLLLIDSFSSFRNQDFVIANHVIQQGRALVIAVNKWDLIPQDKLDKIKRYLHLQLKKNLEIKNITLMTVSAKTGKSVSNLMDAVLTSYSRWNLRISTGLLNDWLNKFKKVQNLPSEGQFKLKIRFLSQIKTRPPTFSLFVNDKTLFKQNYLQFVKTSISEQFQMQGIPIRLIIRDQKHQNTKRQQILQNNINKVHNQKSILKSRNKLLRWSKNRLNQLNKKALLFTNTQPK